MTHENAAVQKLMEGVTNHLNDVISTECRRLEKAYNAGKLDGYSGGHDAAYKRGLEDAWEIAKKIILSKDDGGFPAIEKEEICEVLSVGGPIGMLKKCDIVTVAQAIRDWEAAKKQQQQEANDRRWVYLGMELNCSTFNRYECPVCGKKVKTALEEATFLYCPQCGAHILEVGNE